MSKIPVGATIAHAYCFATKSFPKVLGVMWLPMAIMWLPGLVMQHQMIDMAGGGPGAVNHMLPWLVPFYVVGLVLICMQVVGIARLAQGLIQGPVWFYFSLGRPVWRLIGSMIILIVALIIGWLAVLLASLLIGGATGLLARAIGSTGVTSTIGVAAILLMTATWVGYIYCVVRLSYLLLPIIAAGETGFALARSWTLGKGNFWRMLAIWFVSLLPLIALEAGFFFYLFHGIPFPTPNIPAQEALFQAAIRARTTEAVRFTYRYWYVIYPLSAAVMVFCYGLMVSAQSFSWRALTDDQAQPELDQRTMPG
jgi:hypothetical protein